MHPAPEGQAPSVSTLTGTAVGQFTSAFHVVTGVVGARGDRPLLEIENGSPNDLNGAQ